MHSDPRHDLVTLDMEECIKRELIKLMKTILNKIRFCISAARQTSLDVHVINAKQVISNFLTAKNAIAT